MSQHIDAVAKQSSIVNNLTTNDSSKALSAAQGKALNDKYTSLNSNIATHDFGMNTVANHQTAIVAYAATLEDLTVKNISFLVNENAGEFSQTRYIGQLIKTNNNRINVEVRQGLNDLRPIVGKYTNGTWEWNKLVLNSNFVNHTVETVMSVYVEPTFENGVATVDLTTYLNNRGFTRLEQIVGAQFNTKTVQATVIRGADVVSGNTIKIATTNSSFNGEYGVVVMFRGNY